MRILVVSDLHYRLPHYDWLVKAADDVDVVALVGDLADVVNAVPFEAQVVVLEKYLEVLGEKAVVLASSGNHDLDGPGEPRRAGGRVAAAGRTGRHPRRRKLVDLDGTRFTICPWWDGPQTRAGGRRPSSPRRRVDRPERWVWLYHSPPAGTVLCRDGRREFPDHDLAEWIAEHQPDLVLCGHIHQAPWLEGGSWHDRLGDTRVFNAGKQRSGPVPAHITIDTDAGTAEWFGVYSVESIDL